MALPIHPPRRPLPESQRDREELLAIAMRALQRGDYHLAARAAEVAVDGIRINIQAERTGFEPVANRPTDVPPITRPATAE